MNHQKSRKKLNMSAPHRRAFIRNQVISLIMNDCLTTTKARAKVVRSFAEKMVTLALKGNNFNARRRAKQLLPYKDEALVKLFIEIAPRYENRPGGYTRILSLGRRISDTADMARVEWVA
jgi:large subunit ribosomal protein L17